MQSASDCSSDAGNFGISMEVPRRHRRPQNSTEGRRRMLARRRHTLPVFIPTAAGSRAGGYAVGLTALQVTPRLALFPIKPISPTSIGGRSTPIIYPCDCPRLSCGWHIYLARPMYSALDRRTSTCPFSLLGFTTSTAYARRPRPSLFHSGLLRPCRADLLTGRQPCIQGSVRD